MAGTVRHATRSGRRTTGAHPPARLPPLTAITPLVNLTAVDHDAHKAEETTAKRAATVELACARACETLLSAWNGGLRLHEILVRLHLNPDDWTGIDLSTVYPEAAGRLADCLPYWSKVSPRSTSRSPRP